MFNGSRVLLKTPLNPSTGYGKDGILLAQNLEKFNCDLHLEPKHVGLPLPLDVAELFAKERSNHFDIGIHHAYPGELGFPESVPLHVDKTVGWTMYEFTGFGDNNLEMTDRLAERLQSFDMLLVYDEVSQQALLPYMYDPNRVSILQGGYNSKFWTPREDDYKRNWDNTFMFCMNGTMNARKNPWAVLLAFKALKDEHGKDFDAELHLKTTTMSLPPPLQDWCPDLYIHYDIWSESKLRDFYSQMHCILAPSWGEGKNLPALEAQTMGCVAAVSAFGGHMQWADPSWTYLMEGPIEEHEPKMGSMRVYPETVAETMWHIYNNREEAKRKADYASSVIPQQCDWFPILEKLQFKLNTLTRPARASISM